MMKCSLPVILVMSFALSAAAQAKSPGDSYLWLEDAHGAKAMKWVIAENAKTLAVLEADQRYDALYHQALDVAQAKERIATPRQLHGEIYNFWQDGDHVRGIWRHVSKLGYADPAPAWTISLDLDALARDEKANWVWQGANCREPAGDRCLIGLSDGGEDAVTEREFDIASASFIADGFNLPRGKQRVAWEDPDSLLVAREWAPGDLTKSGYPFIVKRLKRGQKLDAAVEVFRGTAGDGGYGVSPVSLLDSEGHRALLILRPLSTFEREFYLVTDHGPAKLALPAKADIIDLLAGRLVVDLNQDWQVGGKSFPQGSLVSLDLAAVTADPHRVRLSRRPARPGTSCW
jgi:prolyl oligopeptidase